MSRRTRSTSGFTLLELLLALVLLSVVIVVAMQSGTSSIQTQARTEQEVTLEASLRRTADILSQDLRTAAYGVLTSTPYVSASSSVSLAQMLDTSVHAVTGPGTDFRTVANTDLYVPSGFSWARNTRFLLINPERSQATILTASADRSGTGAVNVPHAGQQNTVCFSPQNLAQHVELVGYSLNTNQQVLFRESVTADGTETAPLAFGVTGFTLSYVDGAGTVHTSMSALPAGQSLARVNVTLQMTRTGRGGAPAMTRSLTTFVEMPRTFTLASALRYVAPGTTLTC